MASEKITAIIEELKGLTVLELSELVHAVEDEFGVSAAAAVAVAGPAADGGAVFVRERETGHEQGEARDEREDCGVWQNFHDAGRHEAVFTPFHRIRQIAKARLSPCVFIFRPAAPGEVDAGASTQLSADSARACGSAAPFGLGDCGSRIIVSLTSSA